MSYTAKVLVVEDDEDWQEVYKKTLEPHGYKIEIASSCHEAKNLLMNGNFDVAIVDLQLNEDDKFSIIPDGMNVIEEIYKTYGNKLSIIIASQHGNIELVKTAYRKYNVFEFLEKGKFKPSEFISLVDEGRRKSNTAKSSATLFISYARTDVETVREIYEILMQNKYRPWMDIFSIKGGEDWFRAITKAIDESEIFLAILSNNSVSRRGVIQKELKKALDKWDGMLPDDIFIIPIRIDDCPIPEVLKHIQVLDWNNGKGKNKLLEAIRVGMSRRENG